MIIIAVFLFAIFFTINLQRHLRLYKESMRYPIVGQRITINHKNETKIRIVLFMPVVILLMLHFDFSDLSLGWWIAAQVASLITSSFIVATFFWLLFDGFFNTGRGFNWFFDGTIDKDEANSDNFLRGKKPIVELLIKLSAIGVSIFCYFLLHNL